MRRCAGLNASVLAVQALNAICSLRVEVELVTCMLLISTLGRNNAWELAEATFMAFFRQSGHFRDLEEMEVVSPGTSAKPGLRSSLQLWGGMDSCRRSGGLLSHCYPLSSDGIHMMFQAQHQPNDDYIGILFNERRHASRDY
jgi:hypothetical protein